MGNEEPLKVVTTTGQAVEQHAEEQHGQSHPLEEEEFMGSNLWYTANIET